MENSFSNDQLFQERLQAKTAGELQGKALEELNNAIAQWPEAAAEARFSGKLGLALRHKDKLQVNTLIGAIIAEEGLPPATPGNGSTGSFRGGILGWLTGFLLLSLTGVVVYQYFTADQSTSAAQLFGQYFAPLENVIITPDNSSGIAEFDRGMEAYDRGDFARAARHLDNYYQQTGDSNAGLFLGVALLEQGNFKAALSPLQNSQRNLQAPALDACRWYLALAYLQNNEPVMADSILQLISGESIYGDQARALQKALANLK